MNRNGTLEIADLKSFAETIAPPEFGVLAFGDQVLQNITLRGNRILHPGFNGTQA
jgi:hypothetical protein